MRTTMTLDDELAKALKKLAHDSGKSFKEVVNRTVCAGLGMEKAPKPKPYTVKPTKLGGVLPGVNLDKALQIAERLEDEEIARKIELRK